MKIETLYIGFVININALAFIFLLNSKHLDKILFICLSSYVHEI